MEEPGRRGSSFQEENTLSTELQKRFANVRDMLARSKTSLQAALPKHITPERMARLALTACQQTPKLLECDPKSFIGAIVQAAQLGLEVGNGLGHAYLVPYDDKNRGLIVQLIPGYRGLIDLVYRSNRIVKISAHVVYEKDKFGLEFGTNEKLYHVPADADDRGKRLGAYMVAETNNGAKILEWMSAREVLAAKKASRGASSNFSPWNGPFEDEMWRKTAVRRGVKYLPVSSEDLSRALELEDAADDGTPQEFIVDEPGSPAATMQGVFDDDAKKDAPAPVPTQQAIPQERPNPQAATKPEPAPAEKRGPGRPRKTATEPAPAQAHTQPSPEPDPFADGV